MKKLILLVIFTLGGSLLAQAPGIYSVTPNEAYQGASIPVMISGANYVSGTTTDFGTGITVTNTTFITPNFLRSDISIDVTAPIGPRDRKSVV